MNQTPADELKKTELALADRMAIERTKLSNERTFLSYLRTSLTLLAAGFTIIRLDMLEQVYEMGMAALLTSPVVLAFGIYRFINNRRRFNKLFTQDFETGPSL